MAKYAEKFDSGRYEVEPGKRVLEQTADGSLERTTMDLRKQPGKCLECGDRTNFYDTFLGGYYCSEECTEAQLDAYYEWEEEQDQFDGGIDDSSNPLDKGASKDE